MASPSYWGDVTGQLKVFIDRCTPYSNTNLRRPERTLNIKGVAVAIRAGNSKGESLNLIHTIEHFLGHLDIPTVSFFTVEGINNKEDLLAQPQILADAHTFGESLCAFLC